MADFSPRVMLTGAIRSGKSTAVRTILSQLGWDRPAGYVTAWRGQGMPASEITISIWGGNPKVMARYRPETPDPGKLPFEFDPIAFAETVIEGLKQKGPLVIDELGVLEQDVTELLPLFNLMLLRRDPVLLVVQERAMPFWQMLLNADGSFDVIHLTHENRNALPQQIAERLNQENRNAGK